MAEADRKIDHRLYLHDFTAPEIVGGAKGKQGNQDSSRSLHHEKAAETNPAMREVRAGVEVRARSR
jgi:hypothetical protein